MSIYLFTHYHKRVTQSTCKLGKTLLLILTQFDEHLKITLILSEIFARLEDILVVCIYSLTGRYFVSAYLSGQGDEAKLNNAAIALC